MVEQRGALTVDTGAVYGRFPLYTDEKLMCTGWCELALVTLTPQSTKTAMGHSNRLREIENTNSRHHSHTVGLDPYLLPFSVFVDALRDETGFHEQS